VYKFTNKVLLGVLGLSLVNSVVFGIDAEFKNSLMKIEVNKASESAYIVNLYTKNKFSEPVKVIKKSDLNYYILLPETKNESNRITSAGVEIRSVSTNVYPYAGQDVKNGYVKINIDTTKPIEFKVNVKNIESAQKVVQNTAVVQSNLKETTKKEVVSAQKKNFVSSTSKKEQLKEDKISKQKVQKPSETLKIEEVIQQEVQKAKEEMLLDDYDENIDFEQSLDEIQKEELSQEDLNELEQIIGQKVSKEKSNSFKTKLKNKLVQYGISLKEFVLMVGAFLFSFLFMLAILTRKAPQIRLKNKSDLIEREARPNFNLRHKEEVKNDGQYFVFDKNVKQTGFCDPSIDAIKKNYELSTYEPELKNKYERNVDALGKTDSEYDIIQKILKEDTFIDLPENAVIPQTVSVDLEENKKEEKEEPKVISKPIKEEKKEVKKINEPSVLSSVEIAPERGFMCVSYNDNISLMGYIFDDVFALHNFKAQKLENYDIKFRLSEKDDKLARFIVKVANTKMLIKVTKSSMTMEVLL